jgi:tRNA(Ile)-lysidine synthase
VTELASAALNAARTHQMWQRGDRILVALSGGPDSVALLHVLCELRESQELTLGAFHVNFHLRERESDGDRDFCRRLCASVGVVLHAFEATTPPAGNVQDWARRERLQLGAECMHEHEFDRVAVAHTADDRAETFLLQLFRGAGPEAMGRLLPAAGEVVRPFVHTRKAEILDFLRARRLPFRIDRSNFTGRYRRNRIRHELLTVAGDIFETDAVSALNDQADLYALDAEYVERAAVTLYSQAHRSEGEAHLSMAALQRHAPALQLRALRRLARDLGATPGRAQSLRLQGLANQSPGRRVELGHGVEAERGKSDIWIYLRQESPGSVPVKVPGHTKLPDGTSLQATAASGRPPYPDGRRIVRVNLSPESHHLAVRPVRAGDRMQPFGMQGRRLVFDLLAEAGVPRHRRDQNWVLTDGENIYWLLGIRQAEVGRIDTETEAVYEFSWIAED